MLLNTMSNFLEICIQVKLDLKKMLVNNSPILLLTKKYNVSKNYLLCVITNPNIPSAVQPL